MSRLPDAATVLARALVASGPEVLIDRHVSHRWASATFTGARHEVLLQAPRSPALDAWAAALPEAEFALRGHLLADIVVTGQQQDGDRAILAVEALTVEDGHA